MSTPPVPYRSQVYHVTKVQARRTGVEAHAGEMFPFSTPAVVIHDNCAILVVNASRVFSARSVVR